MREDNEPTLEKLDDYNGKESPEKRRTIWLVLLVIVVIGAIFSIFETSSKKSDIIETLPKSELK